MYLSSLSFILIYTFLLLYHPPILPFNIIHILCVIAMVYLILNRKDGMLKLSDNYQLFMKYNVLFLLFSSVLNLMRGNLINIYIVFLYVVEVQICVIFLVKWAKKWKVDLLQIGIYCGVLQSIISLMEFLFPTLQQKIIDIYVLNGFPAETTWFIGKRFFGFSGQLTFTMPVLQVVFAIIVLEKLFNKESNKKLFSILEFVLLVFSALINARISIIILAVGVVYLLIKYHKKITVKDYLIFALITVSISLVILLISSETFYWIYEGIKEIILMLFGESDNGYFSTLFHEFLFFPKDIIGFLFGHGISVFNVMVDGMRSDVGYIIDIWMYGLVGLFLKYFGFVLGLIKGKQTDMFSIYLLVIAVLCNIKGPVFENNELVVFISIYLCAKFTQKRECEVNEKND